MTFTASITVGYRVVLVVNSVMKSRELLIKDC